MIEAIIAKVWPYILLGVGILAGIFGYGRHKKAEGREEVLAEHAKATIKGMEDKDAARQEIESLGDADVRERARQRMRNNQDPR